MKRKYIQKACFLICSIISGCCAQEIAFVVGAFCQEGARYYDRYYVDVDKNVYDVLQNSFYLHFVLDEATKDAFDALGSTSSLIGPKYLDIRGNQDRFSVNCSCVTCSVGVSELREIFNQVNDDILNHLYIDTIRHPLKSCSTALIVILGKDDLLLGQAGRSSRVVISRGGKAVPISSDDVCISKFGVFFSFNPYVCQVEQKQEDDFLILFTDGVARIMSDQEVVDCVGEVIKNNTAQQAACSLVARAIEKTNEVYFPDNFMNYLRDDMTALVVLLNKGFCGIVGVYDGTGPVGTDVAMYLQEHLPNMF